MKKFLIFFIGISLIFSAYSITAETYGLLFKIADIFIGEKVCLRDLLKGLKVPDEKLPQGGGFLGDFISRLCLENFEALSEGDKVGAQGKITLDKIKVPVIFTGAQRPIHETGSDAKPNLERSFQVLDKAAKAGVAECMIFFGDEAYRGVCSRKRSESDFKGFESPSVRPLYVTDGFGVKETWPSRRPADALKTKKNLGIEIKNDFAKGVVILSAVPGLEAEVLMAIASRATTRAIILNSLGAGNIPSLEGDYNLVPAIEKITRKLGKPVIISSPFVGGDTNLDIYLTGTLAKESGAIDAGKMTAEATLVKTRLLLAQPEFTSQNAFKKALATDFAGETGRL